MQRVLTIVGALALAACTAKSPTAPGSGDIISNWSGPISDALLGTGTLSLSLVQSPSDSVTGTWATTFADPNDDLSGAVAGNIRGSTLSAVLKPNNPPTCQYGPFGLTASLAGTTSMSGTFATLNCTVADSGTFSATKQ
jgi:hypothetical protein